MVIELDPSSRFTRWAMKLSEYNFVVEHRPGTRTQHADALSRNVSLIGKDLVLSREVIREEQQGGATCVRNTRKGRTFGLMRMGCYITRSQRNHLAW
jgi:hypothetical protein